MEAYAWLICGLGQRTNTKGDKCLVKRLDRVFIINWLLDDREHNWEDLCIMLRDQQTCTFNNHNYIKGHPVSNQTFADCCCNASFVVWIWYVGHEKWTERHQHLSISPWFYTTREHKNDSLQFLESVGDMCVKVFWLLITFEMKVCGWGIIWIEKNIKVIIL